MITYVILVLATVDNGGLLADKALGLPEEPIPWPHWTPRGVIWFFEKVLFLTNQQQALPWLGLWLSLPMKAGFAFAAVLLVELEWIKIVAGLYFIDLMMAEVFHFSVIKRTIIALFGLVRSMLPKREGGNSLWSRLHPFWQTVIRVDLGIESVFSFDEAILTASRLTNPIAAAMGMIISTFTMRLANGPFQRLIRWEPAFSPAIYIAIGWLGIELILHAFHIDIYEAIHMPWLGVISSLLVICIVVTTARTLRAFGLLRKPLPSAEADDLFEEVAASASIEDDLVARDA